MSNRIKVQPNDPCPCWTGKKFKHCCRDIVDWTNILRSGQDHRSYLSIRGRNLLFCQAIVDALGFDASTEFPPLPEYKKAFTAQAVRAIYEAILDIWPPNTKIQTLLERSGADVSGLYIGDYAPEYIRRALVRHSIYANKILLVDPFMHPYITSDKYNPILHPEQHRAQTLRNVNLYFSIMPWVDRGIVEFIRTPADFDRKLNWDAMQRAVQLKDIPEVAVAVQADVAKLKERHFDRASLGFGVLSAPDEHLRRRFRKLHVGGESLTEDDFIAHINALRDDDPNFLEPLGPSNKSQLQMTFAGGAYEMAKLSAQIARSYLFTDLQTRWTLIEHDRKDNSAENKVWSPFAKAVQNAKLHYLNNLELDHALKLREENRLEGVRSLLTDVWKKVRSDDPFDGEAAVHLANDLTQRVEEAEAEWLQIRKDLVKIVGAGIGGAAASAGPVIAAGHGAWLAVAGIVGAASTAVWSGIQNASYLKKHPAAFFMDLRDD